MLDDDLPVAIITSGVQPLLRRAVDGLVPPWWLVTRRPARMRTLVSRPDQIVAVDGDGFAAAANAALEHARGLGYRALLLLNDDAWLRPGARSRLAAAIALPGVAAAGALLVNEDGTSVQSAGLSVSAGGGRVVALRPQRVPGGAPRPVRALPATALALRVGPALDAGGFDARGFPFYFEDVDLCLRLRSSGYRLVLVPDAVAVHRGAATAGRGTAFSAYHQARGQVTLCRKLDSAARMPVLLAGVLSVATLLRPGTDSRRRRATALLAGIHDGMTSSR
jgi:GT2 family glycosyltransferase